MKHFSFNVKDLPKHDDFGMNTSYDTLDGDMKKLEEFRRDSCFGGARHSIEEGKVAFVRYYPWSCPAAGEKMYKEVLDKYIETAMTIPFIKERVKEYTGYSRQKGKCTKEASVLVDMRPPISEGFVTLQVFRLAQEKNGHLFTFAHTLEETGNPLIAFLLALNYNNCSGTPRTNGHIPSNEVSISWARQFIDDPSIARAVPGGEGWTSRIFYPKNSDAMLYMKYSEALRYLATDAEPLTEKVFVYGTLREGQGNHALLKRAIAEARAMAGEWSQTWLPVVMYDTGHGFPALVPCNTPRSIAGEVYYVNKQTFAELDRLEGYPHLYDRVQITADTGDVCWVYVQKKAHPHYTEIKGGDWCFYVQNR